MSVTTPKLLLGRWIARQAAPDAAQWLEDHAAAIGEDRPDATIDHDLAMILARMPRRFGRDDLFLDAVDLAEADAACPGWSPAGLSLDGAARIYVLLALPAEGFAARFRRLRQGADLGELVALFRGLPLYPDPHGLEAEAAEGLRTNMRAIFEAIAHNSPYPAPIFDQHRWNHMVLKALFVGSALAPIQGLEARANKELAVILRDYVRERRAAGRPLPPDLWRCLEPHAAAAGALDELAAARLAAIPAPAPSIEEPTA
ncbi:hypothetical protein CLG96_02555 [Sphingomonas oleivorans]|uniref:Uncharacterized protein n=1 Tax=Sphingomonas oleivorans TaxID=1735121 RepID=A0A2T5G1R1_9SPHN|nr:EboA domain-containing protein [Sphingomonas oleivorans]PTQ13040.1 hypothetical protein CLG96_02555 [Sphingomonas oleivorans]